MPAPEIEQFLREPHVAALATVRPDGRPHVAPVWYEYDGREFIVSTFRNTQKFRNVQRRGFAALSIHTGDVPYRHVVVEGAARAGSVIDNVWRERVAVRYLGEAGGRAYVRDTGDWEMMAIFIRPLKWHTQGFESERG